MPIKKNIYRLYDACRKAWWGISGHRRERLFGYDMRFTKETELSESVWFHYPKQSVRQRIVMYADYVQSHSMVSYLESLPDHPVVVEIGAYHGGYAVLLGKIVQQKKGKLIAVEASPKSAKVLRQNVEINRLGGTVEVIESFVQDSDDELISLVEHGSQSTAGQLRGGGNTMRSEAVSTLLNRINVNKIDLLLIDIEGAEIRVLPAFPWSQVKVDRIYCEMHPGEWHRFGNDGSAMEQVIREQQFVCLDMYFQEFSRFRTQHYAGPALMIRQPCPGRTGSAL